MTTTPLPPDHDTPDQPLIDALWQQLRYPPERTDPATDDFTTAVRTALESHRAGGHTLFTSVVHRCCGEVAFLNAALNEAVQRADTLEQILERSETGHVTFTITGSAEVLHPDWCRECRVDAARAGTGLPADPETVARQFHETYERLAPAHGYATREASAKPWEQVPEQNRGLMIAVAAELLADWQQAECRQAFVPIPPQPVDPPQDGEYQVGDRVQVVDAEGTVLPAAGRVRIQLDAGPVIEVEKPFVTRIPRRWQYPVGGGPVDAGATVDRVAAAMYEQFHEQAHGMGQLPYQYSLWGQDGVVTQFWHNVARAGLAAMPTETTGGDPCAS